jgi:hypothetical protein
MEESEQTRLTASADTAEKARLKLYKTLLEKYADIINEKEKRTVGEIKSFISKDNLTIQSILGELIPENYSFPENYLQTAQTVFAFVKKEIVYVEPDTTVNFWLTPQEIFSGRVADDEDLSVFLCSLLYGLGDDEASVVIAELDTLTTHAFVLTEFEGTQYILDPAQDHAFDAFSGSKEACIEKYRYDGTSLKQFLYKFNHSQYEQFL